MGCDAGSSDRPPEARRAGSPQLQSIIDRAQRLAQTPDERRDLGWHVEAFYVGDMTALASARLRTPASTR